MCRVTSAAIATVPPGTRGSPRSRPPTTRAGTTGAPSTFDPLLGYEPHTQLIEASDAGGRRHFLDGRPVHAGTTLELLMPDGHWLSGRYEWNFVAGEAPTLDLALGGPAEAQRQGEVPVVSFPLPARAVLRWPQRGERP